MIRLNRVAEGAGGRRHSRLLAPAAVIAGLGAVLAGCTTHTPPDADSVSAGHVLSVGFSNLSQRYIEPVRPETLALVGLTGLAEISPGLGVARQDGHVTITLDGVRIGQHSAPGDEDVHGWARLAAAALDDARRAAPEVRDTGIEDIYRTMFRSALTGLDRYSRYATPEATRRSRASRDGFGGLGITIDQDDGTTVITRVHEGTPAAAAGLKVDDRITHVDSRPIHALPLADVVALLRGPVEDAVRLTLERDGRPAPFTASVTRAHIVVPTVHARREGGMLDIKLSGFNQGTASALRRALVDAEREMGEGLRGIVLDMRGNPGGLLDQAVAVADMFISRGRIISTKGRHPDSDQIFDATPGELAAGRPLAVLVNGRSASAAEIVAVALRDAGRAVIIGSTSFGKGTVQTIIPMPNGGEMILTWARIHAPSGQTLDHQGVVPALCTAGEGKRVSALIAALEAAHAAHLPLADKAYRPQKGTTHFSQADRAACPPSPAQGAADLRAARLLLGDAALYAQAVTGAASIARR